MMCFVCMQVADLTASPDQALTAQASTTSTPVIPSVAVQDSALTSATTMLPSTDSS